MQVEQKEKRSLFTVYDIINVDQDLRRSSRVSN